MPTLDDLPDAVPDDNALRTISSLVREKIRLDMKLVELEEQVADTKAKILQLERERLPEAMTEAGTSSFRLEDGSAVIEVSPLILASFPSKKEMEKREQAIQWLVDNNYSGIITVSVGADFSKGRAQDARALYEQLSTVPSANAWKEESVHYQTLNKLAREIVGAGGMLPPELFNSYVGRQARVKLLGFPQSSTPTGENR